MMKSTNLKQDESIILPENVEFLDHINDDIDRIEHVLNTSPVKGYMLVVAYDDNSDDTVSPHRVLFGFAGNVNETLSSAQTGIEYMMKQRKLMSSNNSGKGH